jgi:hypothetical protein
VPILVRAEGCLYGEWCSRGGGTGDILVDRTDRWLHAKYMTIIEKNREKSETRTLLIFLRVQGSRSI